MAISKMMKRRMPSVQIAVSALALIALSQPAPAAPAPLEGDLKLVLATDVSRSMDNEEFQIERDGTAAAFADAEVIKAIQSGSLGRVAVAMFDFSSPQFDKLVVDWQVVKDKASAEAFAAKVRNAPRSFGRRTSVSSALQFGSLMLEASEKDFTATRRVIDVSGDGPNNDGDPMMEAHDKTIAQGVVINGLPVMDQNANGYFPDLDKYYAGCVAGGRGSFVVVVKSYKDFGAAMRHKLILEISRNESQIKQAMNELTRDVHLRKAAAPPTPPNPNPPQTVLRSAPNEFSQHCDTNGGGFGGGFGGRFRRF